MSNNLVKTYYDVSKFVIWADEADDNGGRRPRMVFGFRDGNPRITVYTGNSGPESVISFPSDHPTMVYALNAIKSIANGPPGDKVTIESMTVVYENNKPTKEKKVVSTLYIGKSKEGMVYLSVISEGKQKIVFTIKSSDFHVFRDKDKNVIPDTVISSTMAVGLADTLLNVLSTILVNYTNEEYETGTRKPMPIKGNTAGQSNSPIAKEVLQDLDDLAL